MRSKPVGRCDLRLLFQSRSANAAALRYRKNRPLLSPEFPNFQPSFLTMIIKSNRRRDNFSSDRVCHRSMLTRLQLGTASFALLFTSGWRNSQQSARSTNPTTHFTPLCSSASRMCIYFRLLELSRLLISHLSELEYCAF